MKIKSTKMSPAAKRLQVIGTRKTGYWWNGKPCHCEFVIVRMTANPDVKLYWGTPFAGQLRQVVRVMVPGHQPFYIDNADGTGYIKVVHGLGAPNIFHRGVINPDVQSEYVVQTGDGVTILKSHVVSPQLFDIALYNETEKVVQEWAKIADPDMYERSKELREKARQRVVKHAQSIYPDDIKPEKSSK